MSSSQDVVGGADHSVDVQFAAASFMDHIARVGLVAANPCIVSVWNGGI